MSEGPDNGEKQGDYTDRRRALEALSRAVGQLQREIANRESKERSPDDVAALLAELEGLRQLRERAGKSESSNRVERAAEALQPDRRWPVGAAAHRRGRHRGNGMAKPNGEGECDLT